MEVSGSQSKFCCGSEVLLDGDLRLFVIISECVFGAGE